MLLRDLSTNFYETVLQKPPLVVFGAGILGFIVTLLGIQIFIGTHEGLLINSDIKDWNSFLAVLSGLEICLPKLTNLENTEISTTTKHFDYEMVDNDKVTLISFLTKLDFNGYVVDKNISLQGTVSAKYVGYKKDSSFFFIQITPVDPIRKHKFCVTLKGPNHLFPNSPVIPPSCPENVQVHNLVNVRIVEPWIIQSPLWCSEGEKSRLYFSSERDLNVYISKSDSTTIQLHILYTTSLLVVILIMLITYSICPNRSSAKLKILIAEKAMLEDC